jgi:hypothetical protein
MPPARHRGADVAASVSLGGVLVVAAIVGRHLWFFSDDWNILARYHDGHLLEPFNGHLSLVPAGIYAALFHTVGLGSYWPYRVVGFVGIAALGGLTYRYARPRVGPWPAVAAATTIVWGSGGVTNLMFPFLVNFSLPIALLVAIWLLFDRRSARADLLASLCLAVGLATSGLGVLALGAVGVELAWSRAPLRRWLTMAPPAILWGIWYVGHRIDAPGSHGFRSVASYALRMLWGGCTALAAGWKPGGVVVAIGVVALVATAGLRWHRLDARALGALSAPLLFAGLTAFSRLHVVPAIPPDELRYRWTVAAGIVLAVVCLWPRASEGSAAAVRRWSPTQQAAGAVAVVAIVAGAVVLMGDVRDWVDTVVAAAPGLRAELFAAEATRGSTPGGHVLPLSYVPVTERGYLDAIDDVGSPLDGFDPAGFGGSADHRRSADELLAASARPIDPTTVDRSRCARTADRGQVSQGTTVIVESSDGSRPTVRLARFHPEGAPVELAGNGGAAWGVRIPTDATGTPRGAPPYAVLVEGAAAVWICP